VGALLKQVLEPSDGGLKPLLKVHAHQLSIAKIIKSLVQHSMRETTKGRQLLWLNVCLL
jgi:hypothetical protein